MSQPGKFLGRPLRRHLLWLAAIVALAGAPASAALAENDPTGGWEGVVVFKPAEVEVDVFVELGKAADGNWVGTLDVPVQQLKYYVLHDVSVAGPDVAFKYIDKIDTSIFRGRLSADGKSIDGEVLEQGDRHPFHLTRKERTEPPAITLHNLSPSGAELTELFNREANTVRLVVMLSPTCPACAIDARVVERYLMEQVDSSRLRLYVVWGPMGGDEKRQDAERASALVPDRRATQFWTDGSALMEYFRRASGMGLKDEKAWKVFLLYAAGSRWNDAPASFMHDLGSPLPPGRRLNGVRLREEVVKLLAATPRGADGKAGSGSRKQRPSPGR